MPCPVLDNVSANVNKRWSTREILHVQNSTSRPTLAVPPYANATDLNVNLGKYMTFVASFVCLLLN